MPQSAPNVTIHVNSPGPLGEPSYLDVNVASVSGLNPGNPAGGTFYDTWCLNALANLNTPGDYTAAVYGTSDAALLTDVPTLARLNLGNLDSVNWLLGYYNGSNPGIVWQEVQFAIWKLMGQNYAIGSLGDQSDVDALYTLAMSHDGYVPALGQTIGVLLDPVAGGVHLQPLIIETKAAQLSHTVWQDSNANGIRDAGEIGIPGAAVQLARDLNGNGAIEPNEVLASTTTDMDGRYQFAGLTPGVDYRVAFTQPAAFDSVSPRQVDGSATSASNSDGLLSDVVQLAPGENNQTVGAGFFQSASLGDKVWVDANANGQQDVGEVGAAQVTVNLLNAAGVVIATQATDASGNYLFKQLTPGTYSVQFVASTGYVLTSQNSGSDVTDSDADTTSGKTGAYTLNSGDSNLTVDAGLVSTTPVNGHIGDKVWEDTDGDGLQDAGELGVAGVTVQLRDASGAIIQTKTTDTNGAYGFDVLPGTYSVVVVPPAGYNITQQTQGGDATADSDIDPFNFDSAPITVGAGTVDNTVDAGLYRPVTLGDKAWVDTNANGQQDAGEPGKADVMVQLFACVNGLPGAFVDFTMTDANGHYSFSGLAPGQYYLQFISTDGAALSAGNAGTNDALDSDAVPVTVGDTLGLTGCYTLNSGEQNSSIDAGFIGVAPPTGHLGDAIWQDTNGNGVRDAGELGLAGVTVQLKDASGTVVSTQATDTAGNYGFDVVAGTYSVAVVLPSGYSLTPSGQGADPAADSDFDPVTHTSAPVVVASGSTNNTVDGGLYQAAKLGDKVWLDVNANGQQDAGEAGVANVAVNLLNAAGTAVATQTTDALGNFLFNGLAPGNYSVQFVAPSGYAFTSGAAGATGTTGTYALNSGDTNLTVDAGLVSTAPATGHVGDKIWFDTNGNGVQNMGEAGFGGVTVQLLDAAGAVVATTATNGNGFYGFDVAAGTYSICVMPPAGYDVSPALRGTTSANDSNFDPATKLAPVTVVAGATNSNIDGGLFVPASLGDRVWIDANSNGQQDAGEVGKAGVTVKLLNTAGAVLATQTTDANGNYLFTDLAPGSYCAQFEVPAGYTLTTANTGADATDSDAVAATGKTGSYTLVSRQSNLTVDAGLVPTTGGVTPLVIDLNGNGIHTTALSNSTGRFDLLGSGLAIDSGWITGDDAFLAVDRNGNGCVDDITELFGGTAKGAGFAQLAPFDSNGDSVVDALDTRFGELSVWRDANGNHITDDGELIGLAQAGVASLAVGNTYQPELDAQGNLHGERSSATLASGQTVDMTDLYFAVLAADAAQAGLQLPTMAELLSLANLGQVAKEAEGADGADAAEVTLAGLPQSLWQEAAYML